MRIANRIGSAVLAVVLAAAGVLLVVQVVLSLIGRPSWWPPFGSWYDRLSHTALSDWRVLAVSVGALVVGGLIIALQAKPRRPSYLTADPPWWLNRGSVERRVAGALRTMPGVADARATARGRPDRWRLRLWATTVDGQVTPDAIERTARDELARLTVHADVPMATTVQRRHR